MTASLRERKKLQTRADIVAAAVRLFREQGYEETTVEQIAEAANYSRATVFRYFASKEDVLFSDADERLEELRSALADLHGTPDPWRGIRDAVVEQVTLFASGDPEAYRTSIELMFSNPALHRRLAVNMAWEEAIAEFLAAERGKDVDADIHSQVIAAMMTGTVRTAMRAEHVGTARLEGAIRQAFDVLEAGLSRGATSSRAWLIDG